MWLDDKTMIVSRMPASRHRQDAGATIGEVGEGVEAFVREVVTERLADQRCVTVKPGGNSLY